ncbi:hypothetical protein JAAARDRAFT_29050 [Jaapia argillacea MUCL 33604]|uniref:Isocitrate lyase n=1 Tax=Jaapia argillacea MUCL 33604 TaxID=933084 RepID=A0A067Q7M5_9AGAM|nr:hypothetical protein JAAARDRAFT_29050 [Jaapia argillacea MUCL 33604]
MSTILKATRPHLRTHRLPAIRMPSSLPPVSATATVTPPWSLPLDPPSVAAEQSHFTSRVNQLKSFFSLPRFSSLTRPYTPESVVSKQGSVPPLPLQGSLMADKLYGVLERAANEGKPVHTMGAIDPVQMSQMARCGIEVTYVSGWACSSVLTTCDNEVGPDLGDYPYTTVPNQVQRLFKAQLHHDRKHYDERLSSPPEAREKMQYIDYLRPIIADADTGHGGISSVMKLTKLFAEAGAAAIHLEDQLHGGKKCGHLSGKVLAPTSTHTSRLIAARYQLDLMQGSMLLIARTDAESARLVGSSVDGRDGEWVRGVRVKSSGELLGGGRKGLADAIAAAEARGASGPEVDKVEKEWMEANPLCTFHEAVQATIQSSSSIAADAKESTYATYIERATGKTNAEAREIAREVTGEIVGWDWDLPRTREGYYHYTGGIQPAIQRALAYAPYADLVWLETKTPDLAEARDFARQIREKYPGKWLVYNLSPSFNWSAMGFSDVDLKNFIWDLAKEGFVLQLISLAGLHSPAAAMAELAGRYKTDGMLAYVELVQRKEKELGCDVLTHQKWSGANYIDRILSTVSSGSSSTSAIGTDSTEHQF